MSKAIMLTDMETGQLYPAGDWPSSESAPKAAQPVMKGLSDFTDDEIAREYYARARRQLGDPKTAVGLSCSWQGARKLP